jgi:hypothetical protein
MLLSSLTFSERGALIKPCFEYRGHNSASKKDLFVRAGTAKAYVMNFKAAPTLPQPRPGAHPRNIFRRKQALIRARKPARVFQEKCFLCRQQQQKTGAYTANI